MMMIERCCRRRTVRMEKFFNEFYFSRIIKVTWKANDLPKGVTLTSLSDKLVISLNEGEELYDGEIIDVQNIPDEEYYILDNIDNDAEINSSTKHVILQNS